MAQYVYRQVRLGPGSISPVVRTLIIINVVVFLVQSAVMAFTGYGNSLIEHLGMTPRLFVFGLHLWQPVTYMFLHGNLFHIFFNMFTLWMFGTEVERRMGSRLFGAFYFFCGIGAGLLTCVFWRNWGLPTIGASGAVFGVMLAFGLFFPERMVLIFFVVPVKAIYFVLGLGFVQLYYMIFALHGGISYVAHVGGMLFGFLFLRYFHDFAERFGVYPGARRTPRQVRPADPVRQAEDQRRVDEILDKINREGIHKLSRAERNFLRMHARRRQG